MNRLLDRIAMASQKPDKVPRSARTRRQWQEIWGFSEAHADRLIRQGLSAGVLKSKLFRVRTGNGVRPIPHYFEVKA